MITTTSARMINLTSLDEVITEFKKEFPLIEINKLNYSVFSFGMINYITCDIKKDKIVFSKGGSKTSISSPCPDTHFIKYFNKFIEPLMLEVANQQLLKQERDIFKNKVIKLNNTIIDFSSKIHSKILPSDIDPVDKTFTVKIKEFSDIYTRYNTVGRFTVRINDDNTLKFFWQEYISFNSNTSSIMRYFDDKNIIEYEKELEHIKLVNNYFKFVSEQIINIWSII